MLARPLSLRKFNWWTLIPPLIGFTWCFCYGRVGLHVLDSSIVFDGGYRLLSGERFFRDFYSPHGFTPAWMQAGFFAVFGVNWFAFLLHAALANALFAWVGYLILRRFNLPAPLAAFYASLMAMLFYPPFGTPYPDQHSFLFSLLGVYLVVAEEWKKWPWLRWMLVVPVMLLAGLSKQVPAAYICILLPILVLVGYEYRKWPLILVQVILGGIPALVLFVLMFPVGKWNINEVLYYVLVMPAELGEVRLASFDWPFMKLVRTFLFRQYQTLSSQPRIYIAATILIPLFGGVGEYLYRRFFRHEMILLSRQTILRWLLIWGMLAAGGGFIFLTQNQPQNALGYVFLCIGLAHSGCLQYLEGRADFGWMTWGKYLITTIWLSLSVWETVGFHREILESRYVHDFNAEERPQVKAVPNPAPGLEYLYWNEANYGIDRNPAELLEFLREQDAPFLLWGDMTFLYGLTGQHSPVPSLWIHEGLTIPVDMVDKFYRSRWERKFLTNLRAQPPRYLIYEHPEGLSYLGSKIDDFPLVVEWLEPRMLSPFDIGPFLVVPLADSEW